MILYSKLHELIFYSVESSIKLFSKQLEVDT